MRATGSDDRSRPAVFLALCALAWSALLVPAALFVPVYSSQTTDSRGETVERARTLVEVNGWTALLPIGAVVLLAAAGALALRLAGRSSAAPRRGALAAAVVLLAFGIVGAASIGLFVLPAGVALAAAVCLTGPSAQSPRPAA